MSSPCERLGNLGDGVRGPELFCGWQRPLENSSKKTALPCFCPPFPYNEKVSNRIRKVHFSSLRMTDEQVCFPFIPEKDEVFMHIVSRRTVLGMALATGMVFWVVDISSAQ